MADDIVTRLRTVDEFSDAIGIMDAAADEIERLRNRVEALDADNDRLRRALAAADEYNAALRHHNQQLEARNG